MMGFMSGTLWLCNELYGPRNRVRYLSVVPCERYSPRRYNRAALSRLRRGRTTTTVCGGRLLVSETENLSSEFKYVAKQQQKLIICAETV